MGSAPVIVGIVLVVSFLGFIVLLAKRSGSGPRASGLVARPETLSVALTLPNPASQEHRALFSVELGAQEADSERLTEALGQAGSLEALARGVLRDAAEAWSPAQTPEALLALSQGVDAALSTALRTGFAERGVQLNRVSAHCLEMTPELRRLANIWLPKCTRGGPTGRSQSINALEIYIDGVSGRGEIYTSTSRGAGTRRERTTAADLVADPSRSVNYTVGKPTGMMRLNTFRELMDGAGEQ